tara:strand:+ start:31 stop:270 length:240 start_codon:yes stop_codon:yes gene_type:complete
MPNGLGDGIHPVDLDRLRSLRDPNVEEVAVCFHHKEKKLILKINGIERNSIKVSDPEDKFESCIRWIKEQFILWRTPKN